MKKLILLLFMTMLNSMIWAESIEINGVSYNLIEKAKEAEAEYHLYSGSGRLVLPPVITYNNEEYKVTSIKEIGGTLSSVSLPSTIKKISANAFHYCNIDTLILSDITAWCSITFERWGGESVYSNPLIKAKYLIVGDEEVIDLIIPEGTESISKYAFWCFQSLKSVTIPESVVTIDEEAFAYCRNIKDVNINGETNLISGVFEGCLGLETVSIGDGSTIGLGTFAGCSNLTQVNFAGSIKDIEDAAFINCSKLTSIVIPNTLQKLKPRSFSGCSSLKVIDIPDNVVQINSSAFYGCEKIETVYGGVGIDRIDEYAFSGCTELKDFYLYSEKVPKTSENAFQNSYLEYISLHIPVSLIDSYKNASPWSNFKEFLQLPQIIYMVDGEVYKTVTIKQGSIIIPEAEPTKEGYTFSGWSDIPETMPASDVTVTGTFLINKYKLTYMVDGAEYKSYDVEYGVAITPEEAPTKEGYTFSGWSEIPETMPANDVTVTGTFSVNKYKLTYMVDGVEYKSYDVEYGATITPEEAPTKVGYTFSGWSDIPETMPANDVTVTGTFSVNKYKLTYMVDGAEYKSYDVEYGAAITLEPAPTKDGYTFSGWSDIPATMPANDVTITGTFSINKYKLTYMVDDAEYKSYDIEYGATITPEPAPTKDGYTFSGWSDIPETMPAKDVVVTGSFSAIEIKKDTGEFTATSGSTAELSNDNNVSGEYEIPETVTHDGVTYTVTSIGNEAFKDNTNLTDVTIPSTITSIGESAFAGCSNLKSITVNSTTPIVFPSPSRTRGGSSIFEGVDKNTCILYVPEGSVELYKAAPVWSEFQNILAIGSTGINGIIHNGEPQDVYDLKGRKVKAKATSLEGLPRGIYIINGKKIIK